MKKANTVLINQNVIAAQVGASMAFWSCDNAQFLGYKQCSGSLTRGSIIQWSLDDVSTRFRKKNFFCSHFDKLEFLFGLELKRGVYYCFSNSLHLITSEGDSNRLFNFEGKFGYKPMQRWTQLAADELIVCEQTSFGLVDTRDCFVVKVDGRKGEQFSAADTFEAWNSKESGQVVTMICTDRDNTFEKINMPKIVGVVKHDTVQQIVDVYLLKTSNAAIHKHKHLHTFKMDKSPVTFSACWLLHKELASVKVYNLKTGTEAAPLEHYNMISGNFAANPSFIDENLVVLDLDVNGTNRIVVYNLETRQSIYHYSQSSYFFAKPPPNRLPRRRALPRLCGQADVRGQDQRQEEDAPGGPSQLHQRDSRLCRQMELYHRFQPDWYPTCLCSWKMITNEKESLVSRTFFFLKLNLNFFLI